MKERESCVLLEIDGKENVHAILYSVCTFVLLLKWQRRHRALDLEV